MPENDKTDTEEQNIRPHCVQDDQKDGRKKSEIVHKIPVECSNGSEASGEQHPFAE